MRNYFSVLVILGFTFFAGAYSAGAAQRAALVIGVSNYQSVTPLANPERDARAIAGVLRDLDFDTTEVIDPTSAELKSAIAQFSLEAETADVALVYFAGHGVERAGQNYLIPVDVSASTEGGVLSTAVRVSDVLGAVQTARKLRIVILDSCRDDPFAALAQQVAETDVEPTPVAAATPATAGTSSGTRSLGQGGGLAEPDPQGGTLVAYAAKHGEVAYDGAGEHGPYAQALLDHLATPQLEIGMMFRRVRDDVLEVTGGRQEPFTYGSLSGVPLFLGSPAKALPQEREGIRTAWSSMATSTVDQLEALAETGDPRGLLGLAFIKQNPNDARYDPRAAVGHLRQAAEAGDPVAQFELAKALETGLGVAANTDEAVKWFRAAADQDFPDALNDLGFLTFQGGLGIARDPEAALAYFKRAAEMRHPEAAYNYGALIDDGLVEGLGSDASARYLFTALRAGNREAYDVLVNNASTFSRPTRRALQALLAERGFYTGAIDGLIGPQTTRGLAQALDGDA